MITRFNIGDEVYVRAVVTGFIIDKEGADAILSVPRSNSFDDVTINVPEKDLRYADVVDFTRINDDPVIL